MQQEIPLFLGNMSLEYCISIGISWEAFLLFFVMAGYYSN